MGALSERVSILEQAVLRIQEEYAVLSDRVGDLEANTEPVPVPEPEPEPTPEPVPEPEPTPVQGFGVATTLNEQNTGCRVALASLGRLGSQRITTDNTVIEQKYIQGDVYITGKNVILRDCVIDAGSAGYAVRTNSGGSVQLEYCTIIGSNDAAIAFDNWKAHRCQFIGFKADGAKLGSNCLMEECYMHTPETSPGAHADGVQVQYGPRDAVLLNNRIDMRGPNGNGNAALFICPDQGSSDGPLLVQGNWCAGGNFTIQFRDGGNGQYHIGNITYVDNGVVKDSWRYGATVNTESAYMVREEGNVITYEDGQVLL